jgi:hypothetical protein
LTGRPILYPERLPTANQNGLSLGLCFRMDLHAERERRPIAGILRDLGFKVEEMADGPWLPERNHVLLVLGNINWFPVLRRQLLRNGRPPGTVLAIWHYEPLPPPKASGLAMPRPTLREIAKIILRDKRATDVYTNYFLLRRLHRLALPDILAVTNRGRSDFLAEHGIPASHVPLGYEPSHGHDMGLHRDLDVLYLGESRVPRRRRFLDQLRNQRIDVTIRGDWSDPNLWGEARTRLLNRAKILLNILRFPGEFSGLRFLLAMANGALLISEPVYDCYPFVAGRHFVSASIEEMPRVVRYYLANEAERRRIAEEAYTFVTQSLTMRASVSALADMIRGMAPA